MRSYNMLPANTKDKMCAAISPKKILQITVSKFNEFISCVPQTDV